MSSIETDVNDTLTERRLCARTRLGLALGGGGGGGLAVTFDDDQLWLLLPRLVTLGDLGGGEGLLSKLRLGIVCKGEEA